MSQNRRFVFGSTLSGFLPKPEKSFAIPGILSMICMFSRCFLALRWRLTFNANSPFFVLTNVIFLLRARGVMEYIFAITPIRIIKSRRMSGNV